MAILVSPVPGPSLRRKILSSKGERGRDREREGGRRVPGKLLGFSGPRFPHLLNGQLEQLVVPWLSGGANHLQAGSAVGLGAMCRRGCTKKGLTLTLEAGARGSYLPRAPNSRPCCPAWKHSQAPGAPRAGDGDVSFVRSPPSPPPRLEGVGEGTVRPALLPPAQPRALRWCRLPPAQPGGPVEVPAERVHTGLRHFCPEPVSCVPP